MPQINGLTQIQRELCDRLWECGSQEEVQTLISGMPKRLRREAQAMLAMIIIECIDEEITDLEHCEDARGILVDISQRS
jgi:hypothetical protein